MQTVRGLGHLLASLAGIAIGLSLSIGLVGLTRPAPLPTQLVALPGRLLAEADGGIEVLVLHFVPELLPIVEAPYRDLLATLSPETRVVILLRTGGPNDSGEAVSSLDSFLRQVDPTGALRGRTQIVKFPGPMSVWSKDRALVLAPQHGQRGAELLVGLPPDPQWPERLGDWQTPHQLAAAAPDEYRVRKLPLCFDAGDFAVGQRHVLVDVGLFEKNRNLGFGSPEALRSWLQQLLGRAVLMLGQRDGDVPRHHLSMYLTPLGTGSGEVILLGDPRPALELVGRAFEPGELSPDTGQPLRADFSATTIARYDRVERELRAAGYRVARVPTVVFDDKTYLTYTNGVFETRAGIRIAWVPSYGFEQLDQAAVEQYERLGWTVRPVRVRRVYPFHGTIGCLVNVLARSPGGQQAPTS